jgi:anti-sigma factor RsiW
LYALSASAASRKGIRPAQLQVRECANGFISDDTGVIENLLKLRDSCGTLLHCETGVRYVGKSESGEGQSQKQIPWRTRINEVGEYRNLGRPFDRHIDNKELNALVPSSSEAGQDLHGLSSDSVREAEHHVRSCEDCSRKVLKYRQVVSPFSNVLVTKAAPVGTECPQDEDVDWHEIAAGLWPELKARQLILHAALCDHCGPLLRAATPVDNDPTPQEENLLAQLKAPSRPVVKAAQGSIPLEDEPSLWRQVLRWKIFIPAVALMVVVGVLAARHPSPNSPLSGPNFSAFAVSTHRQHAQGSLALDVRSDSQQTLNQWFKTKLPFSLALPGSPALPGEEWPYRLEGARLVQIGGKTAAYIAYRMQTGPVSLVVTPDSVAVASGGVEVNFKKVSFHYGMVEGYKAVTWSINGLTYALVSQEGNSTQQSCMVCHSAMRDRDLSHTPTPLRARKTIVELFSN